ncbi:MAG: hypothetical protein CVU11_16685 [Bacteroidetes bacterium HGW-Bacteroidetes-6]|nr:MAG: hypothetical protein CVU11_16685 [Bacteroidetes bacterium HGW-Bacteroidetes-6]
MENVDYQIYISDKVKIQSSFLLTLNQLPQLLVLLFQLEHIEGEFLDLAQQDAIAFAQRQAVFGYFLFGRHIGQVAIECNKRFELFETAQF